MRNEAVASINEKRTISTNKMPCQWLTMLHTLAPHDLSVRFFPSILIASISMPRAQSSRSFHENAESQTQTAL